MGRSLPQNIRAKMRHRVASAPANTITAADLTLEFDCSLSTVYRCLTKAHFRKLKQQRRHNLNSADITEQRQRIDQVLAANGPKTVSLTQLAGILGVNRTTLTTRILTKKQRALTMCPDWPSKAGD